jgi:AcrR family transcriptional regulator
VSSTAKTRLTADDWLAGGIHLLADEGLAGIKIDALAERLGVTKGSFYWHFKSLPVFLEAMLDLYINRQQQDIEGFDSMAPEEPRARLMYMMNRISDPAMWNLERAIRGWAYVNPRLNEHMRAVDHWAYDEVRACFERLGFKGHDAEVRAKALLYAGIGFVTTGVLGEPESEEHREKLLDLLLR